VRTTPHHARLSIRVVFQPLAMTELLNPLSNAAASNRNRFREARKTITVRVAYGEQHCCHGESDLQRAPTI